MGIVYGNNALLPEIRPTVAPVPIAAASLFDPDKILSMDLLRMHTKTDDVPTVSDEQMVLYRKAAIEAAEQYTGYFFGGQRHLTERVKLPRNYNHDMRRTFTHHAQYPAASPYVYLLGPGITPAQQMVEVSVGDKRFKLPNVFFSADFTNCCLSGSPDGNLFSVMYVAGFANEDAIPAGIKLGMLKYVMWTVAHPGDVYASVQNKETINSGQLSGTNSTGWASGAIEMWRQYTNEA